MQLLTELDRGFGVSREKRKRESRAEEADDFASVHAKMLLRDAADGKSICPPMTEDRAKDSRGLLSLVVHDVHFWVPVVVLIGGLLVLNWIH